MHYGRIEQRNLFATINESVVSKTAQVTGFTQITFCRIRSLYALYCQFQTVIVVNFEWTIPRIFPKKKKKKERLYWCQCKIMEIYPEKSNSS